MMVLTLGRPNSSFIKSRTISWTRGEEVVTLVDISGALGTWVSEDGTTSSLFYAQHMEQDGSPMAVFVSLGIGCFEFQRHFVRYA